MSATYDGPYPLTRRGSKSRQRVTPSIPPVVCSSRFLASLHWPEISSVSPRAFSRVIPVRWLMLVGLLAALPPGLCRSQSLHEVIDAEIQRKAGGPLAPGSDDAEFLRRVTLDLTGTIPSAAEVREFLADRDTGKRGKRIDQLLASESYARRMQELFSAMLLERRADAKIPESQWQQYLRQAFAENRPWNAVVGELIFAPPGNDKKMPPAARFLLVSGREDPHQKTQDVARLFLGRDMMCAQCHNHPTVDDFTQADYFGLFTFLQDSLDQGKTEFESVFLPGKQTTGPRLPGGVEVDLAAATATGADVRGKPSPRELLSTALPAADNRLFARCGVNRFWFVMMGRGLVHPLDMLHSGNPPSHPDLLEALTTAFAKGGFNVRDLLREIALSDAYQRSGVMVEGVDPSEVPPEAYRTAIGKPLSPEQMAWSVMQATGSLQTVLAAPVPDNSAFSYNDYINGRITKVPDNLPDVMRLFVGVFGNPPGEAEVEFNPAVGNSLFLMNEPLILEWLKPRPGNLMDRLSMLGSAEAIADEMYLSVLTRLPSPTERDEVADYLQRNADRRVEALGELVWALLASAEFRFNH
jgi:hypothetical protein